MTCESARDLVEQYIDDELDASLSWEMREHLAGCGRCTEAYSQMLDLRAAIRKEGTYYRASADFRKRVGAALERADRSTRAVRPTTETWRWMGLAACFLLTVSLAWNVILLRSRQSGAVAAAQEVITSHVRSLMGAHLTDVASSDQHNVKPWFNGKLDFSPDVKDFAAQGFPLIGGRLDYIDGHAAAALVYRRRQHIINLLTWPSTRNGDRSDVFRNGYRAIHWSTGGMTYWAVSDLNAAELRQFADLYQHPVPVGK
jgi:anti-sigma factor RsiW